MASVPDKLKGYIVKEFSEEFGITNQQTLEKMAAALSRAIHTYITTDVEVKTGQQVESQDTVTSAKVLGKTITPGDLF